MEIARRVPGLRPGLRLVPTLVRGKVRWDRNNGKSCSNPSWFFAVVSLALAYFLQGHKG
jgi:hypothetical protein